MLVEMFILVHPLLIQVEILITLLNIVSYQMEGIKSIQMVQVQTQILEIQFNIVLSKISILLQFGDKVALEK